jgi:hypothetical protein
MRGLNESQVSDAYGITLGADAYNLLRIAKVVPA